MVFMLYMKTLMMKAAGIMTPMMLRTDGSRFLRGFDTCVGAWRPTRVTVSARF